MTDAPLQPSLASALAVGDPDTVDTPALPAFAAALAILENTPGMLKALVAGVPTEILSHAPEDQWSVMTVLAHLFLNDPVTFARLKSITDEDQPALAAVDSEAMLASSPARTYTVPTLLYRINFGRAKLIAYLRSLTPTQLERTGEHHRTGTISSIELLHDLAHHDLEHLRQIVTLLGDLLDEGRGPLREI